MSWCFVTQTVFSLDLNGTCIETLHEMATFVLETPHQNTECQLQGCHDSSLTNFNIPPPSLLNAFCRKESTFKKNNKKNGNKAEREYPTANPPKWRFSLFYLNFLKSNIKFSSANLLLTKKKKEEKRQSEWKRRLWLNLMAEKKQFHTIDFIPKSFGGFCHCSLSEFN